MVKCLRDKFSLILHALTLGYEYLCHLLNSGNLVNDTSKLQSDTSGSEIAESTVSNPFTLNAIAKKFFALSAACALFKYIEGDQGSRISAGSVSLSYQAPEGQKMDLVAVYVFLFANLISIPCVCLAGTIMVDMQTIKNLELIHNSITKKSTGTLYGLVNYCSTPMGERLLRMNIVQPMADCNHLKHRFDAIDELLAESDRFFSLKQSLKLAMKKRVDMDKLISFFLFVYQD